MRNSTIVMSSEEIRNKRALEKSYIYFVIGSAILGMGIGYLVKERFDIILNLTESRLERSLTVSKFKNLKTKDKHIPDKIIADLVQKNIEIVGSPTSSIKNAMRLTEIAIGNMPQKKDITLQLTQEIAKIVVKSTWLGTAAWHLGKGKYVPAAGFLTGLLMGSICMWLINKSIDRRVRDLEKSIEILRKEINKLMLQKEKVENYLFLEPLEDTPDKYICPITRMIINDPVIIADKHAYERDAIVEWYTKSIKKNCPLDPDMTLTNPKYLVTDTNLQCDIRRYIDLNGLRENKKDIADVRTVLSDDLNKEVKKSKTDSNIFLKTIFTVLNPLRIFSYISSSTGKEETQHTSAPYQRTPY